MPNKPERDASEAPKATLTKDQYDHLKAEHRAHWVLNPTTGEYVPKDDKQAAIDQARAERESKRPS